MQYCDFQQGEINTVTHHDTLKLRASFKLQQRKSSPRASLCKFYLKEDNARQKTRGGRIPKYYGYQVWSRSQDSYFAGISIWMTTVVTTVALVSKIFHGRVHGLGHESSDESNEHPKKKR
jgi:hypothetical protein